MSRILRMKDGSSIDLVGVGAIAVAGITIAFIAMQVAPVVSLYKHPPKEATGTRDESEAARKYAESLAWDRDQIKNRSLFFIPPRPDEVIAQPETKKYEGPTLSMFVNGTAYFSDGQKVSAAAPDSKSLHFIRADPPWSVRVKWKNGEFDVPIFEKIQLSTLTSSLVGTFPTSTSPHSGDNKPDQPSTDKPAATPDAKPVPTEIPPAPAPMSNGGGGPGGGGDPPPPPPGGAPNGPPPPPPSGDPSPPPGTPPGGGPSPNPSPAPSGGSGGGPAPQPPQPSDPAHPSDHR